MNTDEQLLTELHAIRNRGYGKGLPGESDRLFIELAEHYAEGDSATRTLIREGVSDESRLLLIGFSDRLAILADRGNNDRLLFLALLAHSIEDFRWDERENIFRLALVKHVAEKIGSEPSELFEKAARLSSPTARAALEEFANRQSELASLRAMRIVEVQTEDGVDYRYE